MKSLTFRYLLFGHIILAVFIPFLGISSLLSYVIIIAAIFHILINYNKSNEAAYWAAYWVGFEVFLRMTNTNIVWEGGKYGVIIFLLLGMIVESRSFKISSAFIVILILLIPSVFISQFEDYFQARTVLAFNLSGPLTLLVSATYFYQRRINTMKLIGLLRIMFLPILVTAIYLFFATPAVTEIDFYSESNFESSGGFGPNQVATILGLGIIIIFINIYYRRPMSGSFIVDIILLFIIGFRGLLTLSRGGIIVAIICITLVIIMEYLWNKTSYKNALMSIIMAVFIFGIWDYTDQATGGMLQNRYIGYNPNLDKYEEVSSGRFLLIKNEMQWFVDNPVLGIGPGMTRFYNQEELGIPITTHSEFTRLLAEHGIFGLTVLIILLMIQVRNVNKRPVKLRPIILALVAFAFLTMLHSAMRLAAPGFIYGLTLVNIFLPEKNRLHRK